MEYHIGSKWGLGSTSRVANRVWVYIRFVNGARGIPRGPSLGPRVYLEVCCSGPGCT